MDKGIQFLHNHPMTEQRLGLDSGHVIVDRDAWEHARKQGLNLHIPDVSRRSELLAAFSWVSSIGEQFFDSSKTVEDMVDAYLKSRQ